MACRKHRDIFLATCLLESIQDENYRNTRKLLVEHHANPNLLIPDSQIAAIHFAAGMENTQFAEATMKLILKCNGNPNVQTIEGETPLHIAVIWNRTLIVEMLLDHGADLTITDNENNTPISHAISEKHYNLIPLFQNHIFEKKLEKKINSKAVPNHSDDRAENKHLDTVVRSFHQFNIVQNIEDEKLLTPNHTNFNFKEASPFLININCHRSRYKNSKNIELNQSKATDKQVNSIVNNVDEAIVISSDSDSDTKQHRSEHKPIKNVIKNLFELTQENIEKHLSMVVKKNRKDSLIRLWQTKVNESRQRKSILPIDEDEFEAFLTENTIKTESSSVDTIIAVEESKPSYCRQNSETEASFITAVDENGLIADEAAVNKNPQNKTEVILQTQEVYEHFDADNNIVFYENKLLAKSVKIASEKSPDEVVINLDTSSETETCTELAEKLEQVQPSDYDTDDLRKELKVFGEFPGPITKNTKRLYLRRLLRYKFHPQKSLQNSNFGKCNFSVELQKTMKKDIESLDIIITEYAPLERQMMNNFQSYQTKNMREGNFKKSFIYLLIDPRIAENLLADSQVITPSEVWDRFLNSIFYVGKGKSGRPYAHLYDAIKIYRDNCLNVEKMSESLKLHRIIEIWEANKGVICLPVFHNITPVEAYTREAAIIDCLGVENLTNIKRGDYYGTAKSWSMRDRKKLGVLLLYKAMKVFMIEGESQLRPNDIK